MAGAGSAGSRGAYRLDVNGRNGHGPANGFAALVNGFPIVLTTEDFGHARLESSPALVAGAPFPPFSAHSDSGATTVTAVTSGNTRVEARLEERVRALEAAADATGVLPTATG